MIPLRRRVVIRLDRDVVEVSGHRLGRPRRELVRVTAQEDTYTALERTFRTSPLLRPGRPCDLRIQIESPRTIYRTVQGEGESRADEQGFTVVMPELVTEVLEPIVARRRVHGPATYSPAPGSRAVATMRARAAMGPIGRGLIVDRSSAAVTVLLIDSATIRWARSAPADDPVEAAVVLLRRAGEIVDGRYGLHWWHLEDVAEPEDERTRRREARELEARCHALIGHLPRMTVSP